MAERSSAEPKSDPAENGASKFWTLVNSGIFLWFLTTVAIGGGSWAFQAWRDRITGEKALEERTDILMLELSGRLAQFEAWMKNNVDEPSPAGSESKRRFRAGVTADQLLDYLRVLSDLPRREKAGPYIQEILSEYRDRNFLSALMELTLIMRKKWDKLDPGEKYELSEDRKSLVLHGDTIEPNSPAFIPGLYAALTDVNRALDGTKALLQPALLIGEPPLDHDAFAERFNKTFDIVGGLNELLRECPVCW